MLLLVVCGVRVAPVLLYIRRAAATTEIKLDDLVADLLLLLAGVCTLIQ